jgi:serine/threonine protein phosphatase PrpC
MTAQIDSMRRRLTVGRGEAAIPGLGSADTDTELKLNEDWLREKFPGETVVCICTKTDQDRQKKRPFAEKDHEIYNGDTKSKDQLEKDHFMSSTCRKGMKPESPNQDSYITVFCDRKWNLYGVFDGHGPSGHDASDYATRVLVKKFLQQDFIEDPTEAFKEAFKFCQNAIETVPSMSKSCQTSGSTCTMAFHNLETDVITVAHAGDSRSVLYDFKDAKCHVNTEDHKPNLPAEKARIESRGGRVVFDGYYNYRVFAQKGMYPGLNMSRALGDIIAHKEAGLSADPEINNFNISTVRKEGTELLLLICSDGVWEFIESPDGAKEFKGDKKLSEVDLKKQAEKLAQSSWDKWMADSDNEISDDITVLAVCL